MKSGTYKIFDPLNVLFCEPVLLVFVIFLQTETWEPQTGNWAELLSVSCICKDNNFQ